jgi:hypothetical protein
MYTIEISWGEKRECVFNPLQEETIWGVISRLQTLWNANTSTLNFSAKITENGNIIYDDRINQYVIDGFRYHAMKEVMNIA